jgi:hypothetical protein
VVAVETWLGGGQGGALPHGAGLSGGRTAGDHREQRVRVRRGHPGLEQAFPGGRQGLGHELCGGKRPDLVSVPRWPAEMGGQAVLGGAVEIMIGALEWQRIRPLRVLVRPSRQRRQAPPALLGR